MVLAGLALLHSLPFLCRPVLLGGDEPHYALMARSLAVDRDLDLGADYARVRAGSRAAGARFAGRELAPHVAARAGRAVFTHALGLPLLAAPGIAVLALLAPEAAPDLLLGGGTLAVTFFALLAGIALLGRLLGDARGGAAIALAAYFGTPLWFYSRTFFTDPYLWAFPVLACWCFARRRAGGAGLLLGLAFACKETALLPALVIVAVALKLLGWRRTWPALLASGAVVALWLARGAWLFGDPLATAQPFTVGGWPGLVAALIDRRHGLLPFAPLLLCALFPVSIPGGARTVARGAWASALATLALTGAWIDWGGGTCYGPRLLLPAVAALAVPLALAWQRWRGHAAVRWLFFSTASVGFGLGLLAAWDPFRAAWSPSVVELFALRPIATAGAIVVAAVGAWALARFAGAEPSPQAR